MNNYDTLTKLMLNKNDRLNLLLDIWEEITGNDISPEDNFFALGIDSLLLIKFVDKVSEVTGSRINIADLFSCSDMQGVADIL